MIVHNKVFYFLILSFYLIPRLIYFPWYVTLILESNTWSKSCILDLNKGKLLTHYQSFISIVANHLHPIRNTRPRIFH